MANCDIPDTNPLDVTCAVPAVTPTPNNSCQTSLTGSTACPVEDNCSPFSLTSEELSSDSCIINSYISESLNIGAANINVYKLLGVYAQGKLCDLTGVGAAISGGDIPNYPAANAYDKYITEWRSSQLGPNVLSGAYIGYDFGPIKLANGRDRYGIETYIKHDVATIKLKQGCNPNNRVTKIRVERSNDGVKWFGAALLSVPDCDGMVTLNFAKTVPSRWWRIRPVTFNGGAQDWWSVQALQLIDYEETTVTNIQDRIFLENRDRQYNTSAVTIKGSYTPLSLQTFQSAYGMSQLFGGAETYSIEVSFSDVVGLLGRPPVIGDIFQLPSETQYSPNLQPVLKYLEVTDIAWSTNGYTANWIPTLQKILAQPVIASQETQDILGKLTEDIDSSGLVDIDNGDNTKAYQDLSAISQTIQAYANTNVPERGEDYADVTKFSPAVYEWQRNYKNLNMKKLDRNRNVYGIDAMPPNGLPFTEGDSFPLTPANGDYHRLTYSFINNDIPPRLHRYSTAKGRWIYLETDQRFALKNTKPLLQEFINPETSSVTNPHDMNKLFSDEPTFTPYVPTSEVIVKVTPTPSITPSITPSHSITPTSGVTSTPTPTVTPTPTPSATYVAPSFSTTLSATLASSQDNYSPVGYIAGSTDQLLLTPVSGGSTILGLLAAPDGFAIQLCNVSSVNTITFLNAGSSTSTNQFSTPRAQPVILQPLTCVVLVYVINQWKFL